MIVWLERLVCEWMLVLMMVMMMLELVVRFYVVGVWMLFVVL